MFKVSNQFLIRLLSILDFKRRDACICFTMIFLFLYFIFLLMFFIFKGMLKKFHVALSRIKNRISGTFNRFYDALDSYNHSTI